MDIKNIRDAQLFSEQHLKKVTLFREGQSSAFVINLMPGQELPSHRHPGSRVYLMVFEGEGACTINGNSQSLSWRDVLHCEGTEELSIKNTGRKLMSIYVVLAPGE